MKAKTARRFIIGSLIVGAGGLWTIQRLNADRESKRLTTLAAAYIARNERQNAAECLITALSLYPANTEARRLLLEIAPDAPSDKNNAAPANPQGSPPPIIIQPPTPTNTAPIVVESPSPQPAPKPPDPAEVDAHLAKAQELIAANNPKAAEAEFRAAMALDPTDKSKSQLATFLLDQPLDPNASNDLVSLLRELGRNQSAIGAEALSSGAVLGIVPPAEIESWLTVLRSHPAATPAMLLTVDRLDALLHPRNQYSIAENAARRLRTASLPDRDAGMRWLSSIGEYNLASPLVSLDEAKQDRATMEGWLVNQTHAGNFDAVLAATAAPNLPLPGHTQKIFRGNALTHTSKSPEGLQLMRTACEETGTSRTALLDALAILAIIRVHPLFEEELTKAVSDPDTTSEIVDALAKAVHLSGNAVTVRRFYEIAAAAPALRGDERIFSARDHFRLLLGLDVDLSDLARRAEISREPDPRITYIHGLLISGKPAAALIELEDRAPAIDPAVLTASQQAVVAATFAANNRLREALAVFSQLHQEQLTIQEREWLRGFFDTASKNARSSQSTPPLTTRYPLLATARRIAIDLGALFALFVIWKIGLRVHLWLRREAIG
jgi:tetratricopeptide (TPR) repeat protein